MNVGVACGMCAYEILTQWLPREAAHEAAAAASVETAAVEMSASLGVGTRGEEGDKDPVTHVEGGVTIARAKVSVWRPAKVCEGMRRYAKVSVWRPASPALDLAPRPRLPSCLAQCRSLPCRVCLSKLPACMAAACPLARAYHDLYLAFTVHLRT